MIAIHQYMLMALNGSLLNSAVELSQNSIDSLNHLTTIITITFIPLTIVLGYGFYMYLTLKRDKTNKIHVVK